MKRITIKTLWNKYATQWYQTTTIDVDGMKKPVSELCLLKKDYDKVLLKRYNRMKAVIKESYFGTDIKHINRYKRAAIIAYVISSADPLTFKAEVPFGADDYFLKQRLAFDVALGSIIVDFPKDKVDALVGNIYQFDDLGFLNDKGVNPQSGNEDRDDFLTSVYKDLFFAEVYQNYNVLSMANVFGLLTERSSLLSQLR